LPASWAEIAQEFLDDSKANNDLRTYEFYRYFVVPFVERFGSARASPFPPLSFQKWLNERNRIMTPSEREFVYSLICDEQVREFVVAVHGLEVTSVQ
jgi:hypothetical protein